MEQDTVQQAQDNNVLSIIPANQCSFVHGHQITDNILSYQEVLHYSMRTSMPGKGSMMIKIDLEQAYDRLCWPFIRDTLACTRISMSWSTISCIVWNQANWQLYGMGRGWSCLNLQEGDAISPYLFVMCMERLGHIVHEEVVSERWKHVQASRNGPQTLTLVLCR